MNDAVPTLGLLLLIVPAVSVRAAGPPEIVVRPEDNGAALENPGMGWAFYYYNMAPDVYGSRLAPSDTLDDFPFWPERPVILENTPWGLGHKRGNWARGGIEYLHAVEDYHASYVSIFWWPREFYENNRELIAKINRRLGYRLQLAEAAWPAEIHLGTPFRVTTTWRNAGVAPCYPGGCPALVLKDKDGGIVATLVDDAFEVRDLPVGPPGEAETRRHQAEFELAADLVKPGTYEVFVSVGSPIGTPRIALPLDAPDGHRRYRLGSVVVPAAKVSPGDGYCP